MSDVDVVKEKFYKFVASPLAPQFPSAHEEQEALWFFRAGHASAGFVYTQEQPTRAGWYWNFTSDELDDECIRYVYQSAGNGAFYAEDIGSLFPEDVPWWAGPIPKPEKSG